PHPPPRGRARRRPAAHRPLEVPPPALPRAVPQQRTGVTIPAADGNSAGEADHPHGGRRTPPAGPVAEFPLDVLSPALHRAVTKDRAGVREPTVDGDGTGDGARPHGAGRIRSGPVAQLPLAVPSPAPHRAVPQQRTGVITHSGDRGRARDAAYPHGRGRTAASGINALRASGPVAELPVG